jgi:hypothetical protein
MIYSQGGQDASAKASQPDMHGLANLDNPLSAFQRTWGQPLKRQNHSEAH